MPNTEIAKSNPSEYFVQIKSIIDKWVNSTKDRSEFDTQQKTAINNQKLDGSYIIIDMEYAFPQCNILKEKRIKNANFDLLGLGLQTEKVVFFEVKKGTKALKNKSGIKTHIEDYEQCLFGVNKDEFRKILTSDIKNIISDKIRLGLTEYSLPLDFKIEDSDLDFAFIYEPDERTSIVDYRKIYKQEFEKTNSLREYPTLFVSPNSKYILSYRDSEKVKMMEWINKYFGIKNNIILNNGSQNLYSNIANDVIEHFKKNCVSWWTCPSIGDVDDTIPTCRERDHHS